MWFTIAGANRTNVFLSETNGPLHYKSKISIPVFFRVCTTYLKKRLSIPIKALLLSS